VLCFSSVLFTDTQEFKKMNVDFQSGSTKFLIFIFKLLYEPSGQGGTNPLHKG
jgi:hypothetical protein